MTLKNFFEKNPRVAVAFSGGVDSAYLLYCAKRYAQDVTAYYVKTQFQPRFELEDAKRFASLYGCEMKIIDFDILSDDNVRRNPENRCYYCKRRIFTAICENAEKDGYKVVLDGTNASDDALDRPGMKALKELSVLSPLRECALTKSEIRSQSEKEGLFTFDKPAYACLATRIPTCTAITKEKLLRTEKAEDYLFSLGFSDFRVRETNGNDAKIQIKDNQLEKLLKLKNEIYTELKKYYSTVLLDMETR